MPEQGPCHYVTTSHWGIHLATNTRMCTLEGTCNTCTTGSAHVEQDVHMTCAAEPQCRHTHMHPYRLTDL
jgi:hypothetical protein